MMTIESEEKCFSDVLNLSDYLSSLHEKIANYHNEVIRLGNLVPFAELKLAEIFSSYTAAKLAIVLYPECKRETRCLVSYAEHYYECAKSLLYNDEKYKLKDLKDFYQAVCKQYLEVVKPTLKEMFSTANQNLLALRGIR